MTDVTSRISLSLLICSVFVTYKINICSLNINSGLEPCYESLQSTLHLALDKNSAHRTVQGQDRRSQS